MGKKVLCDRCDMWYDEGDNHLAICSNRPLFGDERLDAKDEIDSEIERHNWGEKPWKAREWSF